MHRTTNGNRHGVKRHAGMPYAVSPFAHRAGHGTKAKHTSVLCEHAFERLHREFASQLMLEIKVHASLCDPLELIEMIPKHARRP